MADWLACYVSQLLYSIDRDRAMQDTVIVRNIPYYKAKKQIEEQVASLEVPPRPSDWEVQFTCLLCYMFVRMKPDLYMTIAS